MRALQRRLAEHAARSEVRYTQVIINHGREAGASLAHPHAQILGLPFVPGEILDEERAFARFAGGCVICTTIEAELADGERVVFADDDVVCIAPFWSGAPFELLLMPRRHELHLQDADPVSVERWAGRSATPSATSRRRSATSPTTSASTPHRTSTRASTTGTSTCGRTWSPPAGFERGTGVMINVTPPELAAETLRAVRAAGVSLISVGADYEASPAEVWQVLEPIESHVDWMADAELIRFVGEQTRGVGTRFECVTRVGPIRLTDRMEITEWEPERAMGVRHDGLVTGTGRFTLEPLDDGRRTRFTWRGGADVPVVAGRPGRRAQSAGRR